MGYWDWFYFEISQEVLLIITLWYLTAASSHPSRPSPVSTADPPPASLNCFHRHTNDILGVRSVALRPHTPRISLCVSEDISSLSERLETEAEHRRSCVLGYFSGRIKRRRASGPGCSGESAPKRRNSPFSGKFGPMSFLGNTQSCPIMDPVTLHVVRPLRTRTEQWCVEMTTRRKNYSATLQLYFIFNSQLLFLPFTTTAVKFPPRTYLKQKDLLFRSFGCKYFGLVT